MRVPSFTKLRLRRNPGVLRNSVIHVACNIHMYVSTVQRFLCKLRSVKRWSPSWRMSVASQATQVSRCKETPSCSLGPNPLS